MVAVIGGKAQRQLRKVARTHDYAVFRVGNVHKYLRSFARLCVFVHHIGVGGVMADVPEMSGHRLFYIDGEECYPQLLAKLYCVGFGS